MNERPRRSWLRWLTLPLIAFTLAALTMVVAPSASAAPCYETSCTGKDPDAIGCSGQTLASVNLFDSNARVDLRYSSGCDANWARLVYSGNFNCCVQFTLQEEQQKWNGSAWVTVRTQNHVFEYGATQANVWTRMNPNETNDRHRACVVGEVCTGWVS